MGIRRSTERLVLRLSLSVLLGVLVACGEEPSVAGSDVDTPTTTTTSSTLVDSEDDMFDDDISVPADDYSDGLPVEVIDLAPFTFEGAVEFLPIAAVVEVVDVVEGLRWNTASGDIGRRSEWEEANQRDPMVAPEGWQEMTVRLVEPIKGSLGVEPGEIFRIGYLFAMDPSFESLDESFFGARGLITAWTSEIVFQDSSRVEMTFMDPSSRFARDDGPAVCLYCLTVGSWKDAGGLDQPVPDRSEYAVAQSLDEVIERARNPNRPIQDHLGYQELFHEESVPPTED